MTDWKKNPGYLPVEYDTLVDVEYRNGLVNNHVRAGRSLDQRGSLPEYNARDWRIDGSKMDIVRWKLSEGK